MKKISSKYYITFISALLFGFIAHGYMFANTFLTRDDTDGFNGVWASLELGRWGINVFRKVYDMLLGTPVAMPWLIGCFTTLYMAGIALLLVHTFQIESKALCIMTSGIVVCFPALTSTYSYMNCARYFCLSMLFATVAAALVIHKKKIRFYIIAVILMILSSSIYQAYIGLAAGILVLKLIVDCMDHKEFGAIIRRGFFYVTFLVLSLAGYILGTKLIMHVLGRELTNYQNLGSMGSMSLQSVWMGICEIFAVIPGLMFHNYEGLSGTRLSEVTTIVLIVLMVACVIFYTVKEIRQNRVKEAFLFLALNICLPIGINGIFLAGVDMIHAVMLYPIIMLYIAAIVYLDRFYRENQELIQATFQHQMDKLWKQKKVMAFTCSTVVLGLLVVSYIYIANAAYMKMQLGNLQAQAYFTTVITQIKSMDGYSEDMKVILYGKNDDKTLTDTTGELFKNITIMGIADSENLVGMRFRDKFLEYFCGYDQEMTTPGEAGIEESVIEAMPNYPEKGSMQIINDTIVVKFADVEKF